MIEDFEIREGRVERFVFTTVVAGWLCLVAVGCTGGGGGGGGLPDAGTDDGGFEQPDTGSPVDDRGPGTVLDVRGAQQPRGLNLELSKENSGELVIRGALGSAKIYEIDMTFESQTLWGTTWEHRASLFVPDRTAPEAPDGAFVVVQGGTRHPKGVSGPSKFRGNYAGFLSAALGIPAMVVSNMPGEVTLKNAPSAWKEAGPQRCFSGGLTRRRYTPCLLSVLRRTGDLRADPFRRVAHAWIRAVTAGVEASKRAATTTWPDGKKPPSFRLARALLLGDGVRGVAARMAAVADNRIDGAFANADFIDVPRLADELASRWRSDRGWLKNPEAFGRWVDSKPGSAWREAVDPAQWSDELLAEASWVHSRGTNDERFPLVMANRAAELFPESARSVTVPNYQSGIGTKTHLASWYGFVARVYLGAKAPTITSTAERKRGNVSLSATTGGEGTVGTVRAVWTKRHRRGDDTDYRDASWSRKELSTGGDGRTGSFAPLGDNVAAFATVAGKMKVPTIAKDKSTLTIQPVWSSRLELLEP